MLERMHLSAQESDIDSRLHTVVSEGMQNLQHFYRQVDLDVLERIVEHNDTSFNLWGSNI